MQVRRQSAGQGKYRVKRKLGKGAFGDVFLVEWEAREGLTALKVIDRRRMGGENEELASYLEGEVNCMKEMNYEHIVQLYDCEQDADYYYMFMEYCDGGNLLNLQATLDGKVFPLAEASRLLSQVINGLEALHSRGYLHRDIKLENVLLKTEGSQKVLKIADFGFAKKAMNVKGTVLGTEQYMSPEIYRCGLEGEEEEESQYSYGFEVDMWAFGVLFFFMLNQCFPFSLNPYWKNENKYEELIKQAKNFSYAKAVKASSKKISINCTADMEDLFAKIFEVNTEKRITFEEIRKHPVFLPHFPEISPQSIMLYNCKYKGKQKKKPAKSEGLLFQNKLAFKVGGKESGEKEKLNGIISSICVPDEEKEYPSQKEIIRLQMQEIDFLLRLVQQIQLVEGDIGSVKCLVFAHNVFKYYIVLFRNFIKGFKVADYSRKYPKYNWFAYFSSQEFISRKKELENLLFQREKQFDMINKKCSAQIHEIDKSYKEFRNAFSQEITETELQDKFFLSYRESTNVMYMALREYLKTHKLLKFYYYLCAVCICHVFNIFYTNPAIKTDIFQLYVAQEKSETIIFSYEKLAYFLENGGKELNIKIAKKIIEKCM